MIISKFHILGLTILLAIIICQGCNNSEVDTKKTASTGSLSTEKNKISVTAIADELGTKGSDDECCSTPGQAKECWDDDKILDNVVTCEENNDCMSGVCDKASNLCACDFDSDCENDGACSDSGLCGPSWCNGYLICSCWGGCEWWNSDTNYTPSQWAADKGLYCCEGDYPAGTYVAAETVSGYLSNSPLCGSGCTDDNDCAYLNDDCTNGICDAAGVCVSQYLPTDSAYNPMTCSDANTDLYPTAQYPNSCYNFYCGEVTNENPLTFGVANGNCIPVLNQAAIETNNTCANPTSLGSFDNTGIATITGNATKPSCTSLQITGSTVCAENTYFADGDDCTDPANATQSLGQTGRDLVYSFTYSTNTPGQQQLRGFMVQIEADFDAVVYVAEDCPTNGAVISNRCLSPYASSVATWEAQTNIWGNSLYNPATNPPAYQQCCNPASNPTCGYKWCKRGSNWTYPAAPVPCDDDTTGTTSCNIYTTYATANMSSAVVYPIGLPNGATTAQNRTIFIFVDATNGEQGNFTLTVDHRNWNASPIERINDDPRVYDVTNAENGGSVYMGTLANAVNSRHASNGACGKYNCADPTVWTGKSTGALGATPGCHGSGAANEFWPNAEYFKIHRPASSGDQPYCITTDESGTNSADLVLDVLTRAINAPGQTITPIFVGSNPVNYKEDLACKHNNKSVNAMIEIPGRADVLYLIGVSQANHTCSPCDPATKKCDYKFTVTPGNCPTTTSLHF